MSEHHTTCTTCGTVHDSGMDETVTACPACPQPGDQWTHDKWPKGTPPATVGKVETGIVTWARGEEGGSKVPNILIRHLTVAFGWHRVS